MSRTPGVQPECAEVTEALSRGADLSAAEREHVAGCPVCSSHSGMVGPGAENDLFAAVQAAVQEEKRTIAGRLRDLPTGLRFAAAAVWAALIVAMTTYATPRSAFGPVPLTRVAIVVGVLTVLMAAVVRIGLRPLQLRPPSHAAVLSSFVLGLFVPAVFAVAPNGPTPAAAASIGSTTALIGCFVIGSVAGLLFIVGLRALDRGAHHSRTSVLLAAVTGGLLGNVALELHCPITAPAHLLLGHVTVGLALLLAYGFSTRSSTSR